MVMKKGVISAIVAYAFVAVLFVSAMKLQGIRSDRDYQLLILQKLQEHALRTAVEEAVADSAAKAFASSQGDLHDYVKAASYNAVVGIERELKERGFSVLFWCGEPSEAAIKEAHEKMERSGKAEIPFGALPISDQRCSSSFKVSLLEGKVALKSIGFSQYFPNSGGKVSRVEGGWEIAFEKGAGGS